MKAIPVVFHDDATKADETAGDRRVQPFRDDARFRHVDVVKHVHPGGIVQYSGIAVPTGGVL